MDREIFRKFGFTSVLWEIEGYCLSCISSNTTEWSFISPEFCVGGLRSTKWRLILRCLDLKKKYSYYFRLQRLGWEDNNGRAIVDCVLEYSNVVGVTYEEDFQCQLSVNDMHEIKLNPGFAASTSMPTVAFVLKCELLVYFADINESIPYSEDEGMRRLSNDLEYLYNNEDNDVTLHLRSNESLYLHKALLYYRIPNVNYRDLLTGSVGPIFWEELPLEAVGSVFRFLYTGKMQYAALQPSIATFRFAELLHVKPIVAYYALDEIAIASTHEAEEFSSSWTIKNFLDVNKKFIESPQMTNKTMDAKWCLKVNLVFKDSIGINIDIDLKTQKNVCVLIYVNDKSGVSASFKCHKRVEGKENFGERNFLGRDEVVDHLSNGSLTVNLRLRIAAIDGETTSIGDTVSCHKRSSVETNYKCLSNDILSLLQNPRYPNMILNFCEHNVSFDVHSYFLLQRCTSLHDAFSTGDRTYFRGTNIVVIRELFHYLYSGTIHESISIDDIFTLYRIGYHFNFASLNTVVLKRLEESLDESNAKEIYNFAIDKNIEKLRDAARIYIAEGDSNE